MDEFKPPGYIASLIAAINDGAKSAQTGALAFLLVALYLVATALSTTDDAILLRLTTSVAQLGVQVSVVFGLAIAPLVLVALHVFTLVRYSLLAANLEQFTADLGTMVAKESERERCRQLLSNVEFVMVRVASRNSPLHSRIFAWLEFAIVAVIPVTTLLVVQVTSLRYQSVAINWVQRSTLAVDLLLLVWFFRRQQRVQARGVAARSVRQRTSIGVIWAPVAILLANIMWLNIPARTATHVRDDGRALVTLFDSVILPLLDVPIVTRLGPPLVQDWARNARRSVKSRNEKWFKTAREVFYQPLDVVICPVSHGWGCRFLTVDHRTLVGQVWRSESLADLRRGDGDLKIALSGVEGVFLRRRTLRFANLSESRLYGADLIGADLVGADLTYADLTGADLSGADLSSANLHWANLADAKLDNATLNGANLWFAHLNSASVQDAHLNEVNLTHAVLTGAKIAGMDLKNANLRGADLSGLDLTQIDFTGANFRDADLTGALLRRLDLTQIDFTDAKFRDADLTGALLSGNKTVTQAQLDQACGNGEWKLPAGLTMTLRACPQVPDGAH